MHEGRKFRESKDHARCRAALAALIGAAMLALAPAVHAAGSPERSAGSADGAQPAAPLERLAPPGPPAYAGDGLIYDQDYPFIGYSNPPQLNDVAHLIERMKSGKVRLQFTEPRGYLDSLLKALHIDPDSQVLVFSKTSLQTSLIGPETPRAIYFNDDTYVAWIADTPMIEITTMDSMMGTVFYIMLEQRSHAPHFERETTQCLQCHDTFSESGGGVPNFLFLSAYTREHHEIVTNQVAEHTSDATPLTDRWGGWYVTGDLGGIEHLGNILPPASGELQDSALHARNYATLDSLFDTQPYLTDKSDVVALLILQHQVDIHNLIIHANYKCRMLMERHKRGSSTEPIDWDRLPPLMQKRFKVLLDPLIEGMLMVNATKFPAPIHGNSGYAKSFEARGPFDRQGRSLRDLDLKTRLFKYPLSFLIYSQGFDYLPISAKQYVYRRLDRILTSREESPTFANLSTDDRRNIFEILRATKPDFARAVAHDSGMTAEAGR
ncbi:MAG: hypothetical protein ACREUG_13250 [Steroidobacteraceae bacterium]